MAEPIDLDTALQHAYAVFGHYPFNPPFVAAESLSPDLNDTLTTDVDAVLPHYLFHAITAWGTVDDFKALLPRLLDALVFDQPPLWNGPRLFEKLRHHADFDHWPAHEQAAVNDFFWALWCRVLEHYPQAEGGFRIGDLLRWPLDPTPYLDYWESQLDHVAAALHLADWIYADYNLLTENIHAVGVNPILDAWVLREAVATYLEETARHNPDHPDMPTLAAAATLLGLILWRRNRG